MANQPWLPYIVTKYILNNWPRVFEAQPKVLEWGSGASTRFFLDLGAYVISIEHDAKWYDDTMKTLQSYRGIDYHFVPFEVGEIGPDKANPAHYKSGSTELGNVNFKNYASYIDGWNGGFDLILIDGMARASCLYHAFNHVNPGGCIVLDNTGDRPYYLEQTEHLFGSYENGWEKITMMGYGPILDYKWETTIFINKVKSDYESTLTN